MGVNALLLPSPLLPPAAYLPLRVALEAGGYATRLADASEPTSGDALVRRWRPQALEADVVIAHSNAGYLLPAVFVDAALPAESGPTPLTPVVFRDQLAALADDAGVLPPWTRWWTREELADLVPSGWFDRLDDAAPRLPLAYLDSTVEPPVGWSRGANAYLAFGTETYADEIGFARAHGWPTRVLPGRHLHHLWDADAVAGAVAALAQALR